MSDREDQQNVDPSKDEDEVDVMIDFGFMAGEAGDRRLSEGERHDHSRIKDRRGERWFPDLMFALTHKQYPPNRAQRLWSAVVEHRLLLEAKLGRNPGIAVAGLDYLTNIVDELELPAIVPEPKLSRVAEVTTTDPMTRLYDHSTFQVRLRREIRRARRYPDKVSLILLDVDQLKRFNDDHGHQAGDDVLRHIGYVLLEETREVDTPARFGGEEFAVIAPSTNGEQACGVAERVRQRIEQDLSSQGITASLGVATFPEDGEGPDELLAAGADALYSSKRAGRNRTTCLGSPT